MKGIKGIESRNEMPLLDHLTEVRSRLIFSVIALALSFLLSFYFYDQIVNILQKPFDSINSYLGESTLFINTIFEGFVVRIKLSFLSGLVLSFPVHILNILGFVFPGLHSKERKVVMITLLCSFIFVVLSFFYSYFSILPVSLNFLTGSGFIPEDTGLLLNFGGNIFYVLQFLLASLVIFQVPILLEILMILNVLSRRMLLRSGRYVVIVFFILSAILTPPDFITQIGIALPLTCLYFLTILVAKIFRFGEG